MSRLKVESTFSTINGALYLTIREIYTIRPTVEYITNHGREIKNAQIHWYIKHSIFTPEVSILFFLIPFAEKYHICKYQREEKFTFRRGMRKKSLF